MKTHRSQRGFTIATAIFLVVILAILSAFILNIGLFQSRSTALDIQGVRAYQAARAGLEAGVYNSLRVGVGGTCAGQTITLGGTLSGFTAVVTCSRSPSTLHNEGGTLINVDTITSTACNQTPCPNVSGAPPVSYVERQLTAVVENP